MEQTLTFIFYERKRNHLFLSFPLNFLSINRTGKEGEKSKQRGFSLEPGLYDATHILAITHSYPL